MGEYCQQRFNDIKRDNDIKRNLIDDIKWSQNFDDFVNNVFKYRFYCIENGLDIDNTRIFDINNTLDKQCLKKIKSFYNKKKVSKDFNKWFKKTCNTPLIKNIKFYASKIYHNEFFQCMAFIFSAALVAICFISMCPSVSCVR